ncbi:hypothetical protein J6590_066086 [Homalodisca vitripennis]|nr:hypothetical protein J6590_066086 [Homalodisca vitripennis]
MRKKFGALISYHVPSEGGGSSSEPASPVKAVRGSGTSLTANIQILGYKGNSTGLVYV